VGDDGREPLGNDLLVQTGGGRNVVDGGRGAEVGVDVAVFVTMSTSTLMEPGSNIALFVTVSTSTLTHPVGSITVNSRQKIDFIVLLS